MVDEHKRSEECDIYGVDVHNPVTPLMARDALIKCFESAHSQELEDLKNYGNMDAQEFENMKRISVEALVKSFFKENGDDYNAPTKDSLKRVVGKLAIFAQKFRNQEIVKKHYDEMMKVMEKLQ